MNYQDTKHAPIVYYLIGFGVDSVVKIGTTVNITDRIKRFQRKTGREYTLLAAEYGDTLTEKQRHREFSDLHLSGEWFYNQGPLADYIAALPEVDLCH